MLHHFDVFVEIDLGRAQFYLDVTVNIFIYMEKVINQFISCCSKTALESLPGMREELGKIHIHKRTV